MPPAVFPQLFANESMSDHVGFARVFIEILNENDNRPIFSSPLYNISLPENTPPGTSLLRISVSILENGCAVFTLAENVINYSEGFLWFIPEEKIYWNLTDYHKSWHALVTFMGHFTGNKTFACFVWPMSPAALSLHCVSCDLWWLSIDGHTQHSLHWFTQILCINNTERPKFCSSYLMQLFRKRYILKDL